MSDVIYLLVLVAFFAAAAGLVNLCQRVIGDDDAVTTAPTTPPTAVHADGTHAVASSDPASAAALTEVTR